jgi:hypothetical protein
MVRPAAVGVDDEGLGAVGDGGCRGGGQIDPGVGRAAGAPAEIDDEDEGTDDGGAAQDAFYYSRLPPIGTVTMIEAGRLTFG